MEDLPLGRIAALVPEFAVKDLPLGQNTDDDYNPGTGCVSILSVICPVLYLAVALTFWLP